MQELLLSKSNELNSYKKIIESTKIHPQENRKQQVILTILFTKKWLHRKHIKAQIFNKLYISLHTEYIHMRTTTINAKNGQRKEFYITNCSTKVQPVTVKLFIADKQKQKITCITMLQLFMFEILQDKEKSKTY